MIPRHVFSSLLVTLFFTQPAFAQAVAPLPSTPAPSLAPTLTVVPSPAPGFPTPGFTPAGAGLPGERVPATPPAEVQRSNNWRPAGKSPQLMNPDGVRSSLDDFEEVTPNILGVPLPIIGTTGLPEKQSWLRWCSSEMTGYLKAASAADASLAALIIQLLSPEHEKERICLVGELMKACVRRSGSGIQAVDTFDLARYQNDVSEWARLKCVRESERPGGAYRSWLTSDVLRVRNAIQDAISRSKQ